VRHLETGRPITRGRVEGSRGVAGGKIVSKATPTGPPEHHFVRDGLHCRNISSMQARKKTTGRGGTQVEKGKKNVSKAQEAGEEQKNKEKGCVNLV